MDSEDRSDFGYAQLFQPSLLVLSLLTYSIGLGLVHHQGGQLDWINILFGCILSLLFFPARNFLSAYYDHPGNPTCTLQRDDPRYSRLKSLEKQNLLIVALTILTAGALVVVLLLLRQALNLAAVVILAVSFLISFLSALPPIRLEKRGYGEIAEAILLCNLIPAIAYVMNESSLHTLLIMLTLPLTLLYLAVRIILSLETYAFDKIHHVQSLVTRLDWLKAMQTHNYLLLMAYLFIGLFALIGQPWSLTWPMLLTFPIGAYQVIQILMIISGAPPRWKVLKLTANANFVILAYLISFTLWMH